MIINNPEIYYFLQILDKSNTGVPSCGYSYRQNKVVQSLIVKYGIHLVFGNKLVFYDPHVAAELGVQQPPEDSTYYKSKHVAVSQIYQNFENKRVERYEMYRELHECEQRFLAARR